MPRGAGSGWSPTGERSTRPAQSSFVPCPIALAASAGSHACSAYAAAASPSPTPPARISAMSANAWPPGGSAPELQAPGCPDSQFFSGASGETPEVLQGTRSPTTTAGSVPWTPVDRDVAAAPRLGHVEPGVDRRRPHRAGRIGPGDAVQVPAGRARPDRLVVERPEGRCGRRRRVADRSPAMVDLRRQRLAVRHGRRVRRGQPVEQRQGRPIGGVGRRCARPPRGGRLACGRLERAGEAHVEQLVLPPPVADARPRVRADAGLPERGRRPSRSARRPSARCGTARPGSRRAARTAAGRCRSTSCRGRRRACRRPTGRRPSPRSWPGCG